MKQQLVILVFGLGTTVQAFAAIPALRGNETPSALETSMTEVDKCSDLAEEIKNLRTAQSVLMKSLVQKNDTLAETLDIFAKDVLSQKANNKKTNSKKLKQAATSFRSHSLREQGLVDRFEALAQDLYSRIDDCLVTKTALRSKEDQALAPLGNQNLSPVTSTQQ